MKTTINLEHKKAVILYKMLRDHIKHHPATDPEKWGWKLIFNDDGVIEVWNGRHGINSKMDEYQ